MRCGAWPPPLITEDEKRRLNEAIEEVKAGRVILTDWLPIKNFLRNGFKTR